MSSTSFNRVSARFSWFGGAWVFVAVAQVATGAEGSAFAQEAPAGAALPPGAQAAVAAKPLDVREAPFSDGDYSWMNGTSRQPDSLLKIGPLTLSMMVDGYYQWQFAAPADHTVFPTTVAVRHNEISLNLASIGLELPPNAIDGKSGGPIGQLSLQYGSYGEAIAGQDSTFGRGGYLSKGAFAPLRTASAGWHFHALHGVNLEAGLFSSFIGLDSYLPHENWNYLHSFLADFTPFYLTGVRLQAFPTATLKAEVWVVNGWQTFGQWHEGRQLGYSLNWRPDPRLSLTTNGYLGQDAPNDDKTVRVYTDHIGQWQYFRHPGRAVESMALAGVFDIGYESRSNAASGMMGGASLGNRFSFKGDFALALRADLFFDETQALLPSFPVGSAAARPTTDAGFLGGGFTMTVDYAPSPWLLVRAEYMQRSANVPLFSGAGGITPPAGSAVGAAGASAAVSSWQPDLRHVDRRLVANVTLHL